MLFWGTTAIIVVVAAGLIWRAARTEQAPEAAAPDLNVYRAQLAEIERDLARGSVNTSEAESLRTEIKRRILTLGQGVPQGAQAGGIAPVAALFLAMIVGVYGLYTYLGAPDYPDLPHADRIAHAEAMKAERPTQAEAEATAAQARPAGPAASAADLALMDQLRAAVASRPGDVKGLQLLAVNERKLNNLQAAARAQEKLVAALGAKATAMDWAALADYLIAAADGLVTAEAEKALGNTLALDPGNGTARFYSGLLAAQTGRPDQAFAIWNSLLKDSPAEAPWVAYVTDQMPALAEAAGVAYTPPAGKGPDATDVAAAAQMSAQDRAEMIKGMVAGLEERLFTQGGSAAEWAQLMTALGVLGDKDRANAAWQKAQAALQADPAGLDQVRVAATKAGVAP